MSQAQVLGLRGLRSWVPVDTCVVGSDPWRLHSRGNVHGCKAWTGCYIYARRQQNERLRRLHSLTEGVTATKASQVWPNVTDLLLAGRCSMHTDEGRRLESPKPCVGRRRRYSTDERMADEQCGHALRCGGSAPTNGSAIRQGGLRRPACIWGGGGQVRCRYLSWMLGGQVYDGFEACHGRSRYQSSMQRER
ncbi:hypothetical protein FB451DRAFT_1174888 [Mycena latifolia]|nr:hypothetical protein FB451DRAFT_1174888 [Mycena latifolia]